MRLDLLVKEADLHRDLALKDLARLRHHTADLRAKVLTWSSAAAGIGLILGTVSRFRRPPDRWTGVRRRPSLVQRALRGALALGLALHKWKH